MKTKHALSRAHAVVAALVCVVVPGASYFDGSGALAYGMFSATRMVRLEIVATRADGRAEIVAPALLAREAGGSAALFFAGADRFRRGPITIMPRAHLGDIAALACRVTASPFVDVTLFERESDDAPIRSSTTHRACSP